MYVCTMLIELILWAIENAFNEINILSDPSPGGQMRRCCLT